MGTSETLTIGRYQVVGKLAQGGMAEILLGRLTGPSGFERPVVIKRILPAFADETAFVNMFLDEARIAARISHPNVVQHQELGREDGQFFLVMEYLEGESLASLQRRLCSRRDSIDLPQAAYIIAEAAAGLHAAHEMTDLDGVSAGVVHRDISPQNLFITYRGGVKVMDFGIAKAADRLTVTEAGSLKGKFAYMSPEQASGEILDRRSDIFSLGIVLYELSTGRRLFRRGTRLASLRAVREGEVPPPSTIAADYPPELEAICLSALALDRRDRYSDAEAMRNALLAFVRRSSPMNVPQQGLRDVMQRLFPDRMQHKKEMLRRVSLGAEISQVPEAEVDFDVEIPSVEFDPSSLLVTRRARPRRRSYVLAAGLLLLAIVGSWAGWAAMREDTGPTEPQPALTVAVPDTPEIEQSVELPVDDTVELTVQTDPPGATLMIGDVDHGVTPVTIELVRADAPLAIRLTRHGYRPLDTEFVPDVDQRLRLTLRRARRGRGSMVAPSMTAFPRFN